MYLVKYRNHCKKIEYPREDEVRILFKIDNKEDIFLQYFDSEFEEYVDCEFDDIPVKSGTLRICIEEATIKNNKIKCSQQLSLPPYMQEANQESIVEVKIDEPDVEDSLPPSQEMGGGMITGDTNCTSLPSSCRFTDPKEEGQKPRYQIPFIDPKSKLGIALRSKANLSKSQKSALLDLIYESFYEKKIYSIGHQYSAVAEALLAKYPHLTMDLSYENAKHTWVKSLYAKFYKRKKELTEPEIAERKKVKATKECCNSGLFGMPFCTEHSIAEVVPINELDNIDKDLVNSLKNEEKVSKAAHIGEKIENADHFGGSPSTSYSQADDHKLSYQVPFIDPKSKLGRALHTKGHLSKKLKSTLLDIIFQSFRQKKMYYIGHQYSSVANALLTKYPYLTMGLPYNTAKDMWIKSLYSKFYKEKKHLDETEIAEKKRLKMGKECCNAGLFEIPNYNPPRSQEGDDSFSVDVHKAWMKSEFMNASKDEKMIEMRMDLTFKDRRHMLFGGLSCETKRILEEYPLLRLENQAIAEVMRLFGNKYFKKISDLSVYFVNLEVEKGNSSFKSHMNNLFSNYYYQRNLASIKFAGNCATLMGENPKYIIGSELNEFGTPHLLVGSYAVDLYVDSTPFISNISDENATILWVAAFYFFHVSVPPKLKKTFELLQYILFNIPEAPQFKQTHIKVLKLIQ